MEEKITIKKKITLELTRGEICMLQELTEKVDGGYEWMVALAEELHEKAMQAYQKPVISIEDYKKNIEQVREKWRGEPIEYLMVMAEEARLKFFYRVEGLE